MIDDHDRCYRAVKSRDARFDGVFYTGVRTTASTAAVVPGGHPTSATCSSTPVRPQPRTPDSARAVAAGPTRHPVAGVERPRRRRGRAMQLIGDGVVEREGVDGLASRLGFSTRHVNRMVTDELGAGPLALARSRRAQSARVLIETTDMKMATSPSRRVRVDPAVQRLRPARLRDVAHGHARPSAHQAVRPTHRPARGSPAVRLGRAPGVPRRTSHRRRRARRRQGLRPGAPAAARPRCRALDAHDDRVVAELSSTTCATPRWPSSGAAVCSTSTQTRSPSARCSAPTRSWPRSCARCRDNAFPVRSTDSRSPCARSSGDRSRSPVRAPSWAASPPPTALRRVRPRRRARPHARLRHRGVDGGCRRHRAEHAALPCAGPDRRRAVGRLRRVGPRSGADREDTHKQLLPTAASGRGRPTTS